MSVLEALAGMSAETEKVIKVVANKDFGLSQKWNLTYQIVVLDHLFQL